MLHACYAYHVQAQVQPLQMRPFVFFYGCDSTGIKLIIAKADALQLRPPCAQRQQQRWVNTAVFDSDVCETVQRVLKV